MLGGRRINVGAMIWSVFVEEADSGEEGGVQADGGKRRRVGRGRVWRWFELFESQP